MKQKLWIPRDTEEFWNRTGETPCPGDGVIYVSSDDGLLYTLKMSKQKDDKHYEKHNAYQ